MSVRCPYCGFAMKIGVVAVGKYTPRCKQCGEKFVLILSNDPDQPPIAVPRKRGPGEETVSPSVSMALGMGPNAPQENRPAPIDLMERMSSPSEEMDEPDEEREDDSRAKPTTYFGVEWNPTPEPKERERSRSKSRGDSPTKPDVKPPSSSSDNDGRRQVFTLDNSELYRRPASQTAPPPASQTAPPPVASGTYGGVAASPVNAGQTAPPPAAGQTGASTPYSGSGPALGSGASSGSALAAPASDRSLRQIEANKRLGGYEIVNKLGQGGMGAVYLARQISLDRKVAVKVLSPQLAQSPSFVARFTREAYAAAQLSHHNIVHIHDIGEESDVHYFSMEFVEGKTLNALLKAGGRVEPVAAVNYVLQAARGLKFAHDHAMIHRDVKPENLLLNDQGLVKVADLGLVKRQGTADDPGSPMLAWASDASTTRADAAMGTPAYMAPEQAKDAARVDLRADIYSLGCTLYDLLTGRPPFLGKTAIEVITKHASEPVTPPEMIVEDIPHSLSTILMKMIAKKPQDRYASMDEVIRALEQYLGESHGMAGGPFTAQEQHVRGLELAVNLFNTASWASIRKIAIWSFLTLCTLGMIVAIWMSRGKWAAGLAGLELLTVLNYSFLSGFSQRSHLFRKVRQYLMGAQLVDWIKAVLVLVVLIAVLVLFQVQWLWLGALFGSFVVVLIFQSTVDLNLQKQRRIYLNQVEGMLKTMRQRGMDEDSLRQFVCIYSGAKWEEFYEALFGYEAKIQARHRWGLAGRGGDRRKWGSWREPIINAIDELTRRRKDERQRDYFARIEERRLRSQGVQTSEARARARKIANNVVTKAGEVREAIDEGETSLAAEKDGTRTNPVLVDEPEGEGFQREHLTYIQRTYGSIWGLLLGSQVRFIAGLVMLLIFFIWVHKDNPTFLSDIGTSIHEFINRGHDELSGEDKYQIDGTKHTVPTFVTPTTALSADNSTVRAVNNAADSVIQMNGETKQNVVSTENKVFLVIASLQGGLAGFLLVFSALFRGLKMGLFMLASTLLILVVGRYLPAIPTHQMTTPEHSGMLYGGVLAVMGYLIGRE